ncbi:MAG: hypothetical protein QM749_12040 [Aquabacterium sp.]
MYPINHATDAQSRYGRLRADLERAYAQPVWNSQQIDQIADEIAKLERAFARRTGYARGASVGEMANAA